MRLRTTAAQTAQWRDIAGPRALSAWLRDLADVAAASGADVAVLRSELVRLRADLNRGVGNNLNQIAAAMNADLKAGRAASPADRALAEAAAELAAMRAAIEEALGALGRRRSP